LKKKKRPQPQLNQKRWILRLPIRVWIMMMQLQKSFGVARLDTLADYRSLYTAAGLSEIETYDVGKLVALIKEQGIADKTLIIFSGDNGSSFDPNTTIGKRFDQTMGGSLRGFKRSMYEGALRQAAIAWWPGTVPAGRVTDEPWAFWDLLPTFAELSGADLPKEYSPDGLSLVSFLEGGPAPKRESFYWELHEGKNHIQALRWNNWKAVRPQSGGAVELYDLSTDLGETKNLATDHPTLVTQAISMIDASRVEDSLWPDPARKMPEDHKNETHQHRSP
jgi:arylsulfatase A-like enzyme